MLTTELQNKRFIKRHNNSFFYLVTVDGEERILKEFIPNENVPLEMLRESYKIYFNLSNKDGLVKVYDFWTDESKAYILMEYLKDYVPAYEAVMDKQEIIVKVFSILANLIRQGYTEIDIAIENFMINEIGAVKMTDLDKLASVDKFISNRYAPWYATRWIKILQWFNQPNPGRIKMVPHKYAFFNGKLIGNKYINHKLKFMEDKFLKNIKGKTLLDIGCCGGYFSLLAGQRKAKRVVGLEPIKEYIDIAKEMAEYLKMKIDFRQECFTEDIVKLGHFDVTLLCSLYHYIFNHWKSHDKIFKTLSQITDSIFFENAVDDKDCTTKKFNDEWFSKEYTQEKILEAAGKYFNCEYLGEHIIKSRKIYWMTKKC